jgi:hypothetical protein
LVEQAAAASQSIVDQTSALNELVVRYQVGEQGHAVAARLPKRVAAPAAVARRPPMRSAAKSAASRSGR